MAKIGTAHIELKPVVDEAALSVIVERIAEAVAEGVRRGMAPTYLTSFESTHVPECNDKCNLATDEHYFLGE